MPYQFRFNRTDEPVSFKCNLQCTRCGGVKPNGQRCKARTCIGTPYCWQHLLKKHLRIKTSTLPGAGKGLFAFDPTKTGQSGVFNEGDEIIQYDGEIVTTPAVTQKYGNDNATAPYVIADTEVTEDGACRRGTGAMANHQRGRTLNAEIKEKDGKLFLVAKRRIKHDAEIFIDYGIHYRFNEPNVKTATVRARA